MAVHFQSLALQSKLPFLRRFDLGLTLASILLLSIGLLSLYSIDRAGGTSYFRSQFAKVLLGLVPFGICLLIDPQLWKRFATGLYLVNVVLLAIVLVKGHRGGGAQRWLQFGPLDFQPSELAKLLIVLTLCSFLLSRMDRIKTFSTFALSLAHVLVPALLVFSQPHLGATLVIFVAWISVSLAAGVRFRYILVTFLLLVVALMTALKVPGVLPDYQKERVAALLSPNSRGNAYQPLRAQIAFAEGGVVGTGFLKGDQAGRSIPDQQTDFIFTVIGEEGGLVGCTIVLVAFGLLFYRIWLMTLKAADPFLRMIAAGIFGILAFHTVVNLSMNLQLLPVVGLWLPFMSFGGTAMWLCMSCIGLLLNIKARERPVLF